METPALIFELPVFELPVFELPVSEHPVSERPVSGISALATSLHRQEIHIWSASSASSLLPRERKKMLASGRRIPQILSCYSEFEKYRFARLAGGKPVINSSPENPGDEQIAALKCTASHSVDMGVYALALGLEIGIDIEKIRPRKSVDGIYRHYFHPAEQSVLENLDESERLERFFQLWTLKEAYGKITGKGISSDFRRLSFHSFSPEKAFCWQSFEDIPGYLFRGQRFESDYWLSVAASVNNTENDVDVKDGKNRKEKNIYGYTLNFLKLD